MPYPKLIVAAVIAAGVVGVWQGVRWVNGRAAPPVPLGAAGGRLAPCPDSPNCISTQADDPDQQMESLPTHGESTTAMIRLRKIVADMPGNQLIEQRENYLRFAFRSKWWGFVDDVEFLVDEKQSTIHFRSASRIGYSDLGVNRARMEQIGPHLYEQD